MPASIFSWQPEAESEAIIQERSALLVAEYNLLSAETILREADAQASGALDADVYHDAILSIFSFVGVEEDAPVAAPIVVAKVKRCGTIVHDTAAWSDATAENGGEEGGFVASAGEISKKTIAQQLDEQRFKADATVAKARADVAAAHAQVSHELSAAEELSRARVKAQLQRRKEGKNTDVSIDPDHDLHHHAAAAEHKKGICSPCTPSTTQP